MCWLFVHVFEHTKTYLTRINNTCANVIKGVLQVKGLDMVRRDWCDFSKDVSKWVLDQLMSDASREDVGPAIYAYLRGVVESAHKGEVDVGKFAVNRSLFVFVFVVDDDDVVDDHLSPTCICIRPSTLKATPNNNNSCLDQHNPPQA